MRSYLDARTALRKRVVLSLAIAVQVTACAQYAWFGRHTDSIRVPGQTVLDRTATYEARILMPRDHAHGGFVYDEYTDGKEDKRLSAGPFQIAGGSYPQSVNAAPKGIVFAQTRLEPDVWHHLAFVSDYDEERLYLDGTLIAAMPRSQAIGNAAGEARVGAIQRSGGGQTDGVEGGFIGYVDYVRVSRVPRYNGPRFAIPVGDLASDADTLLLYNFNDPASSDIVADESPLQRHGTLGSSFSGATRPMLVSQVGAGSAGWFRDLRVNPRGSYLRANSDAAFDAIPIDLAELGIQPGETIFLERIGDCTNDIENTTRQPELPYRLAGVFSQSPTLLGWAESNRVVGAVATGEDVVTPPPAALFERRSHKLRIPG